MSNEETTNPTASSSDASNSEALPTLAVSLEAPVEAQAAEALAVTPATAEPTMEELEKQMEQLRQKLRDKQALIEQARVSLEDNRKQETEEEIPFRLQLKEFAIVYTDKLREAEENYNKLSEELDAACRKESMPANNEIRNIKEKYAKLRQEIIDAYEIQGVKIPDAIKSGGFQKVESAERKTTKVVTVRRDLLTDANRQRAKAILSQQQNRRMNKADFNLELGLNWKETNQLLQPIISQFSEGGTGNGRWIELL